MGTVDWRGGGPERGEGDATAGKQLTPCIDSQKTVNGSQSVEVALGRLDEGNAVVAQHMYHTMVSMACRWKEELGRRRF